MAQSHLVFSTGLVPSLTPASRPVLQVRDWVFWKKHLELTASVEGCTNAPGSLHFGKRHGAQASKMTHHHDQTLRKAKAGTKSSVQKQTTLQSGLTSPRLGNRNYDLGLHESDLIVVNVLFSNGHVRKPPFFFFFDLSLIFNLGGYIWTNWNRIFLKWCLAPANPLEFGGGGAHSRRTIQI